MTVTLLQGDCLELMKQLPDKSVDLVVCDLPYGITKATWDRALDMAALWKEYNRVCKGAVVLTASGEFTFRLAATNLKQLKYDLIWEKSAATGFLNAKKKPLVAHEMLLVFGIGKHPYNPQMTLGHKPYIKTNSGRFRPGIYAGCEGVEITESDGSRYPRSVLKFPSLSGALRKLHPTGKPVALMEWVIKTYSNPGDTVLDNCMGSGTTGVACVNTDRNFIGMELDEGFFKLAEERINGEILNTPS